MAPLHLRRSERERNVYMTALYTRIRFAVEEALDEGLPADEARLAVESAISEYEGRA